MNEKHELKILPQYFQAVWSGIKTFELRKDDRDYQCGDILVLREWDGDKYTGSALCVKVTYILRNAKKYGLKDGYVIMGIRHLESSDWIKVESRPMTEEERKEWSEHIVFDIEDEDAIIYTSKLPDDGQEVLVCNKWGRVWIDTFSDDPDYGVGFEENGDMDGIVAWMPKPKSYEPPKGDDK